MIGDYDLPDVAGDCRRSDGNILPLDEIDTNLKLPLSERYFLGGLGEFQLRGFEARSVGPRRAILYQGLEHGAVPAGRPRARGSYWRTSPDVDTDPDDPDAVLSTTLRGHARRSAATATAAATTSATSEINDFEDLDETDVIGGNKFISSTFEYRFPISETIGLQGVVFFDTGNAFAEDENLFDVTNWRYGTGVGVQWFSPFGPLAVVIGFPLDRLSVEDLPVFEFSVGGQGF